MISLFDFGFIVNVLVRSPFHIWSWLCAFIFSTESFDFLCLYRTRDYQFIAFTFTRFHTGTCCCMLRAHHIRFMHTHNAHQTYAIIYCIFPTKIAISTRHDCHEISYILLNSIIQIDKNKNKSNNLLESSSDYVQCAIRYLFTLSQ